MKQSSVIHSTFVIERSYPAPPEKVFAALSDPSKKRRWFAEGASHDVQEFAMDFRVGGSERVQYLFKKGTPIEGKLLTYQGIVQDIVPNERIVTASTMGFGDKPFSASLVTLELLPTDAGTDLICTHQGTFFEGSDGPQMREGGWRKLFDNLAAEVARG